MRSQVTRQFQRLVESALAQTCRTERDGNDAVGRFECRLYPRRVTHQMGQSPCQTWVRLKLQACQAIRPWERIAHGGQALVQEGWIVLATRARLLQAQRASGAACHGLRKGVDARLAQRRIKRFAWPAVADVAKTWQKTGDRRHALIGKTCRMFGLKCRAKFAKGAVPR